MEEGLPDLLGVDGEGYGEAGCEEDKRGSAEGYSGETSEVEVVSDCFSIHCNVKFAVL